MEIQDQRKIQAHENHGGVHLCHKCGWPFPNSHPSARHRRAHKRVCGKIEGHMLIDSEESNHSTLSEDEHDSDDDIKNPSPVIVESVETKRGIEEDVFSDAIAEFSDRKLAGDTKDSPFISEMNKKMELTSLESFKDCESFDLVQLPSTLTDTIILHNPEIGQSKVDQLENGEEITLSQPSLNVATDIYIDRENTEELTEPELKMEEIIERASDPNVTEEVVRSIESNVGGRRGGSENVHIVSVLESNISENSEALLKDFKDHKGVKVEQLENTDSIKEEILVRESDAIETKFIGSKNPKEEQEIDCSPKDSKVESVIEDARVEGFDPSDICEGNPDTKIEEMKGLEEEHLPIVRELPETDQKDIECNSESRTIVINSNAHDGMMELETSNSSICLVNDKSLIHRSATVDDQISSDIGEAVIISEPLQVERNNVNNYSQANCVDANQGAELSGHIVPLNALSDVDEHYDVAQTIENAAAGAEKSDWKMEKTTSQNSEKSDTFEPPSFTTLVEQGGGDTPNSLDSENRNTKEPQAGWFPSFTPVPSDSDGRKKNEELIAKVANGKAVKQHTPLKKLLDEFPEPENSSLHVQNDGETTKINGGMIGSGQGPEMSEKGCDSPTKLLEEIKPVKKKGKRRSYWAQLVCCTSANNLD